MPRQFIASVLIAALAAMSLTASPAAAHDRGRFVKVLAGATALVIIGKAIEESTHSRTRVIVPSGGGHVGPGYVVRKSLPSGCIRTYIGRKGHVRLFSSHCLSTHFAHFNSLPGACARKVRTHDGLRWGYRPACLRKHGYRAAHW